MLPVMLTSALLVIVSTLLHYEVLRGLNTALPRLRMPMRTRVVVVMLVAFVAHAAEIGLYGLAFHVLVNSLGAGSLAGTAALPLTTALYFSAETYTSLGFGDLAPSGPVRLLAGVEALNGLLLIGWTASFTYLCMERFWSLDRHPD